MSFYAGRIPRAVRANTIEKLQAQLLSVGVALNQKLEIINIYESKNGGLVAWYFHDLTVVPILSPEETAPPPTPTQQAAEISKPKIKPKRKKKAGK